METLTGDGKDHVSHVTPFGDTEAWASKGPDICSTASAQVASMRLSSPDDRLEPKHLGSSLLVSDQMAEDEVVAKPSDRMARLHAKLC